MSLIQTSNLTKIYGSGETAVTALDHVNLKVEAGEFIAVMGPSGCGKSTLLHLIGGLDRPSEGQVTIDGQALDHLEDTALSELRRRKIGFVFQFFNLIPVLNATENAALAAAAGWRQPGQSQRQGRRMAGQSGPGRPPPSPPRPAFRRAAAACGDCPRPGGRAGFDPGG